MPGLQFVLIVCEGSLKLVIVFLLRMADGPQMEEEKEQTPHGLGPGERERVPDVPRETDIRSLSR